MRLHVFVLPAVCAALLPVHINRPATRAAVMMRGGEFESLGTALQDASELQAKRWPLRNPMEEGSRGLRPLRTPMEEGKGTFTRSRYASGISSLEPSFTRLFTHETWKRYTGRPSVERWLVVTSTWLSSTVLRTTLPISMIAAAWAFLVSSLPSALLPRTSPVPMSLMGTALGLLLVFRTNNSYLRLLEARSLWSEAIVCIRDMAQTLATALLWDRNVCKSQEARDGAARACRYLACFAWETRARLMGVEEAEDMGVLNTLLDPEEASFIGAQRVRSLQLLASLRRELHDQFSDGRLPAHIHRKLEEDTRRLDYIVGGCERIFSSPLPPTMSRHIVRCLQLWLLGFPFVLAGTMAPLSVALWVLATSYAMVGIDEVGVQVEQPFEIVPMNKCVLAIPTRTSLQSLSPSNNDARSNLLLTGCA